MNILIVDDDLTNLKLLCAQLESEGHTVFEAHDGVDALALLERQRVDAVISDILMPRMDGYRLCLEIRKHARLRDLPIIIYSSTYISPGDEKLALDMGADKYLRKPASVETLVAALHEAIAVPHAAPQSNALREVEVLKEYNERLVSKLKEKNTELMAAEGKFRTLVEHSIVGIYIIQDDQFVYVNPRMAGIFGWSEEEMTSRTLYDFLVPEDHTLARENIRKRMSGGVAILPYSLRVLHQSGAVLQVEVHGSRTDYNGRPAVMGMLVDITERLQLEAQFRQAQKMDSVGQLASGIAHDFNNLLTAILGYCDLVLESASAGTAVNDDLLEIRRAALRAAELTHQLLAFSRRQMLKPTVFALNTAVEGTEKILHRLISESIVLDLSLTPDRLLVCADPAQVEQVILNLAVNARDAMSRGGRLMVATGECTFTRSQTVVGSSLPPGKYAALSVMDTGSGISPDVRERLFEPFFTTKKRGHGTGLGLATVYGIVQQSGGGVDVQSVPGEGSTFTVYFPLAADEEETIAAGPWLHKPSARGEGTILLAEDDDAVRAIACATLERAGYRVLAATDGVSALALADGHPGRIDLLLTDVIMPIMNGRELAECMTNRRPGLPVLFVSGYTDNILTDLGIPSAGTALLDKPFTPASLTAAVAVILGAEKEGSV